MNMFKLPGSAAGKEAAIVTYSQRREVEVSLCEGFRVDSYSVPKVEKVSVGISNYTIWIMNCLCRGLSCHSIKESTHNSNCVETEASNCVEKHSLSFSTNVSDKIFLGVRVTRPFKLNSFRDELG